MSRATERNCTRVFKYSCTEDYGVELLKMLCVMNEAEANGEVYGGTRALPRKVINYLYDKGYIEPRYSGDITSYILSEEGVNLALIQSNDEKTMQCIQSAYRQYAKHPSEIRLIRMEKELTELKKELASVRRAATKGRKKAT